MTMQREQRLAILQMLICAALWSIAGILIKLIDWHPFVIAGLRGVFSAITVGVFMLVTRQKLVLSRRVFLSAFFLTATFFCFISANKLTTAANAIVLQYTAPIFILLYSAVVFKQRFKFSDILTVVLTSGGIAIFFFGGLKSSHLAGNLVGILSGIFMAGMYVSVGRSEKTEKMSGIFFGQVMTALVGLPFIFVTKGTVSAVSVISVVVLGVVQIGIPYILLALATNHCPPLACSLIGALEPLLNPVWVFLFIGERPGIDALIGGMIVIGAVTAQCVLQDKKRPASSEPANV